MLSKNELKYYSSLLRKKERDSEGKFIAEGKRIVEEGLKSNFFCEIIICTDEFLKKNPLLTGNYSARTETVIEKDFHKLSDTEHPQGVLGVFYKSPSEKNLPGSGLVVLLESVSDPGNAGTIIRNADWFGVSTVIFNEKSVDPYNLKVVRASMGSLFHLDVFETTNFTDNIRELKSHSYTIICADMAGESVYDYKPAPNTALILSSEAFGPSQEVLKLADKIITIPQKGKAESLNVASASAVILSHLTK